MEDSGRIKYIGLAFFVTFLWSTSFIIIKLSLSSITPILFAGYRYVLACSLLLIYVLSQARYRNEVMELPMYWWTQLSLYGIIFIYLTQSFGYLTLTKLPAITLSFVLNFTTIIVIILGIWLLKEFPTRGQLNFVAFAIIGGIIYFYPLDLAADQGIGYMYVIIALLANSVATVHGRSINRSLVISPIVVTTISMTVGALLMIVTSGIIEGIVLPDSNTFFAILWLGVVNTALAFTLWNQAMQHIEALEASIILNTILPQITILSIIFLDEFPTSSEWIGLVIIVISVSIVQYLGVRKKQKMAIPDPVPDNSDDI